MNELSQYSDEELKSIAGQSNDVSSMSDDELMRIAGGQPSETSNELSLRQGKEESFADKAKYYIQNPDELFSMFDDPEKERAKSVQALVDSEALGISPDEAYTYRDQIDQGVKIDPVSAKASRRTSLTDRVAQSWKIGQTQVKQGILASKFMLNGDMSAYEEALKLQTPEVEYIPTSKIESAIRAAAKMLPMTVDVGKEFLEKGLPVGMGAGGAVAIMGLMGPQSVVTVPTATAAGFTVGGTTAAYKRVMELEGGLAVMELMNKKDSKGNPLDPNIVRGASVGIGALNGVIELAQIKLLLKTFPGLDKVLGKAIIDTVSSKTLKERLVKTAVKYGGVITAETGQELAQETTNIVSEALAIELNNAAKGTDIPQATLDQILNRYYETAIESAKAFTVMALPGTMATASYKGGNKPKKVNPSKPPVQDSPVVKQAQETVQSYNGKKPIILGVDETEVEGENVITSFTMADPKTGDVFTVPAQQKTQDETVTYIPDQTAINDHLDKITSDDLDAQIDRMIEGDDTVTGQIFGEDVADFQPEEEITPEENQKTIIDTLKSINESLGERGSVDLEPIVNLGRSIINEGHKTYEAFTARAKEVLGETWEKVKDLVEQAWNTLNNERGSVSIKPMTPKKGTANIPAKTTPQAEAGKYEDQNKIIARPVKDVGLNYGDQLPDNVYLHGSKRVEGDIDNFSVSTSPGGTLYLTKNWDTAEIFSGDRRNNNSFIKAIELRPDADIIDLSKSTDRERLSDLIYEASGNIDDEVSKKQFADDLKNIDFHTTGISDQPEYGEILYNENIGAIKDNFGNVDVISDYAIKTYNPKQLPNPSRPPEVGGQSTLYSGVDITQTIDVLRGLKGNIKEAMPHLEALGRQVYQSGKIKFNEWSASIKETLGDLWEYFKGAIKDIWANREKWVGDERGSISGELKGADPIRQIMNYIKKNGGLNRASLSKQYGKEDIAALSSKYPGIVTDDGWLKLDIVADQFKMVDDELMMQMLASKSNKATKDKYSQKRYLDALAGGEGFYDLKKMGFAPAEEIQAYNLEKGDQVIIDDGQTRVKYEVKGQTQDGKIVLQSTNKKGDIIVKEFSADDTINVTGIKKRSPYVADDFRKKLKLAREARKNGNTTEVQKLKNQLKWMAQRKSTLKNVRDYFGLTDEDMSKISRKNPLLMDEQEFAQYLKEVNLKAIDFKETQFARAQLIRLIEEKRLQKVDNYRRALELPSISEMTTDQLRKFAKLLEPFQNDDVFLTQRELETVDRTVNLQGVKTWREAKVKLLDEVNRMRKSKGMEPAKMEDLTGAKVAWNESFKWDASLREQDPFFDLLVTRMTEAMTGADLKIHNIESTIFDLAKKSEKSRKRGIVERMIPKDELIFQYLEAPRAQKNAIAQQMTPEQLRLAHYMNQYFANYLDYLISVKSVERGRENYITHIRKSFMENVRDKGLKEGVTSIFTAYQEDAMGFNILDDSTGNILPLEKFFQYSLHRTGELDPSQNVIRVFMTYVRTAERKKMFDAIIPELDIYTQSLTPAKYTPRGLEYDRSLKTFVNKWINNKKGRKISYDSVIRQGGPLDLMIRGIRTFTTILDLGFSIPVGIASFVGEQVTDFTMLGVKNYTLGTARMRTDKGQRILKKYEVFTDRSFWEDFNAPGKQFNERISDAMFGLFHVATKTANKQFLLGMMTEEEYKNEELTTERLADLKLEMGRLRVVGGTNSLIGSTSIGNAAAQYKTWAVPIVRTLTHDIGQYIKDLNKTRKGQMGLGDSLTTKEAKELYRMIGLTTVVLLFGSLSGVDDDDGSFIGKLKKRAYREATTLTQGIDPKLWFSAPRILSWLTQISIALHNIMILETYKTKDELKGVNQMKKALTPGIVRQLPDDEEE